MSEIHETQPFVFYVDGHEHRVNYDPGDSDSSMFGGNSNWRGPVWFPLNYLLIEVVTMIRCTAIKGDRQGVSPPSAFHRLCA